MEHPFINARPGIRFQYQTTDCDIPRVEIIPWIPHDRIPDEVFLRTVMSRLTHKFRPWV